MNAFIGILHAHNIGNADDFERGTLGICSATHVNVAASTPSVRVYNKRSFLPDQSARLQ